MRFRQILIIGMQTNGIMLAGVIDPLNGMMLFIDGVKQNSTNSWTNATVATNDNLSIARWGSANYRFFEGQLEDIRISDNARYNSNFVRPCPDLPTDGNTVGLWNFNKGFGSVIYDSSANGFDGVIYGASWMFDTYLFLGTNRSAKRR